MARDRWTGPSVAHSDTYAPANPYAYTDSHAYTDAYPHVNANPYANLHPNAYSHTDAYTYAGADGHTDTRTYGHTHSGADGDAGSANRYTQSGITSDTRSACDNRGVRNRCRPTGSRHPHTARADNHGRGNGNARAHD